MLATVSVLDLLLPVGCAGCGRPGAPACTGCAASLAGPPVAVLPSPAPCGLPPPYTVATYDGVVRELLLAAKERGAVGVLPLLGAALSTAVTEAAAGLPADRPVLLVPVPSTRAAVRSRGDDVVLVLARRAAGLCRRTGRRVSVAPVLRHVRAVRDSAGLGAAERAANLAGALAVTESGRPRLRGRSIIVVDDLMTTGATLAEAARALRRAGGDVHAAATVAATPRRGSSAAGPVAERASVGPSPPPP
jgi:predicted amidophosphoribosyltransferase